mmetsp:Transcript_92042/g.257258  ORF Transcript_92042/g.257258 Transcript_92042/m.257258 type:complete len:234 (+) Transcript_92042:329-1030(+)
MGLRQGLAWQEAGRGAELQQLATNLGARGDDLRGACRSRGAGPREARPALDERADREDLGRHERAPQEPGAVPHPRHPVHVRRPPAADHRPNGHNQAALDDGQQAEGGADGGQGGRGPCALQLRVHLRQVCGAGKRRGGGPACHPIWARVAPGQGLLQDPGWRCADGQGLRAVRGLARVRAQSGRGRHQGVDRRRRGLRGGRGLLRRAVRSRRRGGPRRPPGEVPGDRRNHRR